MPSCLNTSNHYAGSIYTDTWMLWYPAFQHAVIPVKLSCKNSDRTDSSWETLKDVWSTTDHKGNKIYFFWDKTPARVSQTLNDQAETPSSCSKAQTRLNQLSVTTQLTNRLYIPHHHDAENLRNLANLENKLDAYKHQCTRAPCSMHSIEKPTIGLAFQLHVSGLNALPFLKSMTSLIWPVLPIRQIFSQDAVYQQAYL